MANLNLADLNLKLNATNNSDIAFEYAAKENFTPLFEAWGFKRKWKILWKQFRPLGVAATRGKVTKKKVKVQVEEFAKVDYDDYNDLPA